MRQWIAAGVATVTLALAACSGTMPASSTSSSAGGVEVFGTVDTGVTRTW